MDGWGAFEPVYRREADTLSTPQGEKYALLPAGHRQGYQDAFNAFVSDVHTCVRGGAVNGLPNFLDGVRAAQIMETVLQSVTETAH